MKELRILIADDHEVVRHGLRALLQAREGWEICGEAVDGRDAVTKAAQLKPDLVILDIGMPNLNGLDAARQILRVEPRTAVLILTIDESEQVMREVPMPVPGASCSSPMPRAIWSQPWKPCSVTGPSCVGSACIVARPGSTTNLPSVLEQTAICADYCCQIQRAPDGRENREKHLLGRHRQRRLWVRGNARNRGSWRCTL